MKKIISIIVIALFTISSINIVNSEITSKNDHEANYTLMAFIYAQELSTSTKWKDYIAIVDSFIQKNKNSANVLSNIEHRSENTLSAISKTSKNQNLVSFVWYLNAKSNLALLDLWVTTTETNTNQNDKDNNNNNTDVNSVKNDITKKSFDKLVIKVVLDNRNPYLNIEKQLDNFSRYPSLKNVEYQYYDFWDTWVYAFLKENWITELPAIIFSTNKIDVSKDPQKIDDFGNILSTIDTYLVLLPNWEYSYPINSTYNPYEKESTIKNNKLTELQVKNLKEFAYVKWSDSAKFSWIEYSDIECPYCARLHTSWVYNELSTYYPMNFIFMNYPLDSHPNAQEWSELLECTWDQIWWTWYYNLLEKAFSQSTYNKNYLLEQATNLWASKETINACITSWYLKNKVNNQKQLWYQTFWITSTPSVVLLNNYTLEYTIITWAYPIDTFKKALEDILN